MYSASLCECIVFLHLDNDTQRERSENIRPAMVIIVMRVVCRFNSSRCDFHDKTSFSVSGCHKFIILTAARNVFFCPLGGTDSFSKSTRPPSSDFKNAACGGGLILGARVKSGSALRFVNETVEMCAQRARKIYLRLNYWCDNIRASAKCVSK